jgi:CheY-like chemotaxis protein
MQEQGNLRVAVVVEDEWGIRMQTGDILLDDGWEVQEFAAGELALAYLESGNEVHLLISDIRLSGQVTGWDVARAYRKRYPEVRVIYCSGNQFDERQHVSGSIFLSKPCDLDQLRAAIRAA